MGTKYTTQTQSGYNSSAPPDDGSVQASNKVSWATMVKAKIGDPILTLAQAINSALVTALDFGSRAVSATDSAAASDHMRSIEGTNSFTESLPDATATGAGFVTTITNAGTGIITLALTTGTDTLNGVVNGTLLIPPHSSITAKTNSGATGYVTQSDSIVATKLASYLYAAWNPSDLVGTTTNAGALTQTDDSTYSAGVASSGTLTITLKVVGKYLINVSLETLHAAAYTNSQIQADLGGSATQRINASILNKDTSGTNLQWFGGTSIMVLTTAANQTLTILPRYTVSGSGTTGNHSAYCNVTALYCGV